MKAHRKTCLRNMQLRIRHNIKQHAYTKTGVSNPFAPSLRHQLLRKASGIWHQLLPRQRSQTANQSHERNASKSVQMPCLHRSGFSVGVFVEDGQTYENAIAIYKNPQETSSTRVITVLHPRLSHAVSTFLYTIICCFGCLVHFAQETRRRAN